MNYEKKYKEALERARQVHTTNVDENKKSTEYIFPELKESEDELTWLTNYIAEEAYYLSMDIRDNEDRIKLQKLQKSLKWLDKMEEHLRFCKTIQIGDRVTRNEGGVLVNMSQFDRIAKPRKNKAMSWKHWKDGIAGNGEGEPIYLVKAYNTYRLTSCLGFECDYIELSELDKLLEKHALNPQGKTALEAIKEEKINNDINIKPKFKVKDWVVRKDGENFSDDSKTVQIAHIYGEQYWFDCGTWLEAEDIRLWTIQDAKDGDILVNCNDMAFIFKGLIDPNHPNYPVAYCGINNIHEFKNSSGERWWTGDSVKPATKEQCDFLFSKMKEAGYEWDAKNKCLIKV